MCEKKKKKTVIEEPFRISDGIILLTCLFIFVGLKVTLGPLLTTLQRSNLKEQPLVKIQENFFNESTTTALVKCAINSATKARNVLGELFANSRSVAVGFNRHGIEQLGTQNELNCLLSYFNAVRDIQANAWVLNVLVCDANSNDTENKDPVSWHIDQTIALHLPVFSFAAHSVDVWYAHLPDAMHGGELELARFSSGWLDQHAMRSFKPNTKRAKSLDANVEWQDDHQPKGNNHSNAVRIQRGSSPSLSMAMAPVERALVSPRQNAFISFRGDAHHRVRPFHTPASALREDIITQENTTNICENNKSHLSRRISIVLEQYRIPQFHYWNTVKFHLAT